MSGGMEDCGFEAAQSALQIARNRTVRVDGLWYRCEPWGMVADAVMAPVFGAFSRRADVQVDEDFEYLSDVSSEPSLLVARPMTAHRQACYFRKYLKASDIRARDDWFSQTNKMLNLPPQMFAEAEALFGADAAKPRAASLDPLQREFLIRVASAVNDYLKVEVMQKFWRSSEFLEHHKANLAKHGLRGALARYEAPKPAGGPRQRVQNRGHAPVRFGKPK
jgi:hypothetical protein